MRPGARADPARTRLVVSAIEHHAVLDPVEFLVAQGAAVSWLEPDRCGHVAVDDLRERSPRPPDDVALVSVMWANNEVGTVQPVAELAAVAHEHGVPVPHRRRAGGRATCPCASTSPGPT